MTPRRALLWTLVWIAVALVCYGLIHHGIGPEWLAPHLGPAKATQFLTGYLIEKSLSVDNLFVFVMLFSHFKVPPELQRRVLNWGILGVILLRGVLILLGATLVDRFSLVLVVFALLLIPTGYRMLRDKEEEESAEELADNQIVRLFRRLIPVADAPDGQRFVTHRSGRWEATPLLVILVLVETSDLIFAVDSIPAIFAITTDPFIVFSSNLLAVLGLRAMYFLLARIAELFQTVKRGVGLILIFIGVKLLLAPAGVHISVNASLAVILGVLGVSVVASLVSARRRLAEGDEGGQGDELSEGDAASRGDPASRGDDAR